MKSLRKKQKIITNQRLRNQLYEKDNEIIMLGHKIDANHFAMQDLAKFMGMDNIEKLSLFDVIEEIKRRLK